MISLFTIISVMRRGAIRAARQVAVLAGLAALVLLSCRPLIIPEKGTSPEQNWPKIVPEQSVELVVPGGTADPAVVELAGLQTPGFYAIEVVSESWRDDATRRQVRVYLGKGPYPSRKYVQFLEFSVKNGFGFMIESLPDVSAWLRAWTEGDVVDGTASVSLRFLGGPIEDEYPEGTGVPRAFSIETGRCSGVLSRFPASREDFIVTGLASGHIYRARARFENKFSIQPISQPKSIRELWCAAGVLYPTQSSIDAWSFCFTFSSDGKAETSLAVYGEVGCTFTLSMEDVDNLFPNDAWENDDGPLAPLSDLVVDDGILTVFESGLHTKRASNEDWIRFRPLPDASYSILPIVVDALVDPQIPYDRALCIDVCLVRPDGSAQEKSGQFLFTGTPEGGWETDKTIEWAAPASIASDYFVMIKANAMFGFSPEPWVPFSYRLRVTANRP